MPRVGIDMFHFAKGKTDPIGGTATYDSPVHCPGLKGVNLEPQVATAKDSSDNRVTDVVSKFTSHTVTVDHRELAAAESALLLGHKLSEDGGLIRSDSDTPPWGAVLFRAEKSDGTHRYYCVCKVKFQPNGSTNKTIEDGGVTFNPDQLKGEGMARESDGMYEYWLDETPENAAICAAWFESVPTPVAE